MQQAPKVWVRREEWGKELKVKLDKFPGRAWMGVVQATIKRCHKLTRVLSDPKGTVNRDGGQICL